MTITIGRVTYELLVIGHNRDDAFLSPFATMTPDGLCRIENVIADYAADRQCTLTQARLVIECLAFESVFSLSDF